MKTAKERVDEVMRKNMCVKCPLPYKDCVGNNCKHFIEFKQSIGKIICEIIEDEMEIRHCHKLLDRIQKVMGVK